MNEKIKKDIIQIALHFKKHHTSKENNNNREKVRKNNVSGCMLRTQLTTKRQASEKSGFNQLIEINYKQKTTTLY